MKSFLTDMISLNRMALALTLIFASTEQPQAHGAPPMAVPICIAGGHSEIFAAKCVSNQPKSSYYEGILNDYLHKNKGTLEKISRFCRSYIQQVNDIYALTEQETVSVREAALAFLDEFVVGSDQVNESKCDSHFEKLLRRESDFLEKVLDEMREMPPVISFVDRYIDEFRLKPPDWVNANFQRDRNWDYADMAWRVRGFSIALREARHSRCLKKLIDECIRFFGRPPDSINRSGNNLQEIVYFGKKTLFEGTTNENFSVGREMEKLLISDGIIIKHEMTIQVIERSDFSIKAFGHLEGFEEEPYGKKVRYSSYRHSNVE